jgi:hypothetical protein
MSDTSTKTAIITAVLTGVFTIIAGIATYWFTTKEPALSYSVVAGPALSGAVGTKRIFVVEVRNSGKKEVAQTLIQLALKSGELSEIATEATAGVKLVEDKTSRQVDIRADLLNPGDSVKVSLLMSLVSADAEPKVTVRAPGVQAVADSGIKDSPFSLSKPSGLLALLVPAFAAVMSTFMLLSHSVLGEKLGLKSVGQSIDQSEVVSYICGACGLFEEADRLRFGGSEISYRGAADYLRHRALRGGEQERLKYETALRAILLTDAIRGRSVDSIRWAIDVIAPIKISDAEFRELQKQAMNEGSNPKAWRERIDAYTISRLSA